MPGNAIAAPVLSYSELLPGLEKKVISSALMTALGFHRPEVNDRHGMTECQCRGKGGARQPWPCPEVRAIIAALAGEQP